MIKEGELLVEVINTARFEPQLDCLGCLSQQASEARVELLPVTIELDAVLGFTPPQARHGRCKVVDLTPDSATPEDDTLVDGSSLTTEFTKDFGRDLIVGRDRWPIHHQATQACGISQQPAGTRGRHPHKHQPQPLDHRPRMTNHRATYPTS